MTAIAGAIAGLLQAVSSAAGVAVSYRRGNLTPAVLTAIPSRRPYEVVHMDGTVSQAQARDYILASAILVIEGQQVEPAPGDKIDETINGDLTTFEVMAVGAEKCFDYSDAAKTMIRIHTKQV